MSNIYIKINNEYLVLPDNISIQFEWNSPLFDEDVIKGSYSYPFNISLLNATNRRLLGRPDDIKNYSAMVQRITCILGLLGKEYSAYIKTSSASRNSNAIAAVFIKDDALISSKDTSIRSFDYGGVDLTIPWYKEVHFTWVHGTGIDPDPLQISIEFNGFYYLNDMYENENLNNPATWQGVLDNLISMINAQSSQNKVVASRGPEVTPGDGFPTLKLIATIPGKFAPFTVTRIYDSQAYHPYIKYLNTLDSGELFTQYMTDTVNGSNGETRITFAPLYFDGLYKDSSVVWNNVVNYWNGTRFDFINADKVCSVIPLPYFKYILTHLFKNLGYTITGSFFSNSELSRLVYYNVQTLDAITAIMYNKSNTVIGVINQNVFADTLTIANHLPDTTISQTISMHRNTFAAYYIFDNESKTINIGLLDDVVKKGTYIDWSGKSLKKEKLTPNQNTGVLLKYNNDPSDKAIKTRVASLSGKKVKDPVATQSSLPTLGNEENDVRLVIDQNAYYIASFTEVLTVITWVWTFYSTNLYDYEYQGGSLVIDSGNSLYLMTNQGAVPMPYFDQLARSIPFNQGDSGFTSRLMIYRGIQNFSGTNSPVVTREAISGDHISMQWDSNNGLFNRFWKNWVYFLSNARPAEKELNLKAGDLNSLKWDEFYRIENVNYLIKSLSFSVSKNSISIVTANLYAKP